MLLVGLGSEGKEVRGPSGAVQAISPHPCCSDQLNRIDIPTGWSRNPSLSHSLGMMADSYSLVPHYFGWLESYQNGSHFL